MSISSAQHAELAASRTIELTTTGRRSGHPSRIEIWWFHFEERFIITGTPGRRDWFANVLATPDVTIHLNGDSYRGVASPIDDAALRRRFFSSSSTEVRWYAGQAELNRLIDASPMIEILFD